MPPEQVPVLRDGMLACIREAATLGPGTGRWPGLNAWFLPLRAENHTGGAACVQNVSAYDQSGREHAQAICALAGQALWRLQAVRAACATPRSSRNGIARRAPFWPRSPTISARRWRPSWVPHRRSRRRATGCRRSSRTNCWPPSSASRATSPALTENTLQLVRLDHAGELRLDWESVEEIVGAVLARVRQRDVARRIQSRVPAGLPLIKADPVLLAQLLENLLDNALKYSENAHRAGGSGRRTTASSWWCTTGAMAFLPGRNWPSSSPTAAATVPASAARGWAWPSAAPSHARMAANCRCARELEAAAASCWSCRWRSPSRRRSPHELRVLVVEDDQEIRSMLQSSLAVEGFEVRTAVSVERGARPASACAARRASCWTWACRTATAATWCGMRASKGASRPRRVGAPPGNGEGRSCSTPARTTT